MKAALIVRWLTSCSVLHGSVFLSHTRMLGLKKSFTAMWRRWQQCRSKPQTAGLYGRAVGYSYIHQDYKTSERVAHENMNWPLIKTIRKVLYFLNFSNLLWMDDRCKIYCIKNLIRKTYFLSKRCSKLFCYVEQKYYTPVPNCLFLLLLWLF